MVEAEGYADDPLRDELAARFRSGSSGMVEVDGRSLFLTVELPPPRLVLIGAVHISQALAPMARIAGFDTTIIDPRTAFATPERFPDVRAPRRVAGRRASRRSASTPSPRSRP